MHWTAGAKWAEGPAPDGQCATPLALSLSEVLGIAWPTAARRAALNSRVLGTVTFAAHILATGRREMAVTLNPGFEARRCILSAFPDRAPKSPPGLAHGKACSRPGASPELGALRPRRAVRGKSATLEPGTICVRISVSVMPNVRAKRATTAWRAGQQAQNGPQAQRLMAGVTCRWRSA